MIHTVNISDFLVYQRRRSGLTQEELADRSGVSVRTIRNIETKSIACPRPSTIRLMLSTLCKVSEAGSTTEAATAGSLESLPSLLHRLGGSEYDDAAGLTADVDRLIGRSGELDRILGSLRSQRLIALVGPGGVGKTRLARAVAERASSLFGEPSEFINVGAALGSADGSDGSDVFDRLRSLVLSQIHQPPASSFALPARPATELLVVLDGAEHVVEAVSRLADEIVRTRRGLRVIVTTRRQLSALTAQSWEVGPLDTDASAAAPRLPAAVRLFLSLASSACPTLDLGGKLDAVTELCRRLGGLPLAIELAASRIRSVSIDTLLEDGPSLDLLDEGAVGWPARNRSISASMRSSYGLLDPDQQQLLQRLTQLDLSFTVDDIVQRGYGDKSWVIGRLGDLVDSSLVRLERGSDYIYSLQPFVRTYVQRMCGRGDSGISNLCSA